MRKHYIYIILFTILFSSFCFAHSGKTDSKGGHYNKSTGEYHYHHGYPAHKLCGANCPYNEDDKTNHSSGASKTTSKTTTTTENKTYSLTEKFILSLCISILMHPIFAVITFFILYLIVIILKKIKILKKDKINFFDSNIYLIYILGFIESVIYFIFTL